MLAKALCFVVLFFVVLKIRFKHIILWSITDRAFKIEAGDVDIVHRMGFFTKGKTKQNKRKMIKDPKQHITLA